MNQNVHMLTFSTVDPRTERSKQGTRPLTASRALENLSEGFAELIDKLTRLENQCQKSISEKRGRKVACSLSLANLHLEQAAIESLSETELNGDFSPECPEWLLEVVTDLTLAMHGRGNCREAALLSGLALELFAKKQ